jgi:hypothetical protein
MKQEFDLGPDLTVLEYGDRSVLLHCLGLLRSEQTQGWAVEFGTGTGDSTRMIAAVLPVISFDSFKGLPEDWRPNFRKGHFTMKPPLDIPGATIVPGWFEDTVPDYEWPEHLALVHFDADLYSSTITALDSIGPFIKPGCILVFDEFHGYDDDFQGTMPGEQQAFWEWVDGEWLAHWDVIGHGREQWAVRVR